MGIITQPLPWRTNMIHLQKKIAKSSYEKDWKFEGNIINKYEWTLPPLLAQNNVLTSGTLGNHTDSTEDLQSTDDTDLYDLEDETNNNATLLETISKKAGLDFWMKILQQPRHHPSTECILICMILEFIKAAKSALKIDL